MPSSSQVIGSLLQATIVKRVDFLGWVRWKSKRWRSIGRQGGGRLVLLISNLLPIVDGAVSMEDEAGRC
eukprot:scaffold3118_cov64-Cylindrotheca_fusiformis.AAC.7